MKHLLMLLVGKVVLLECVRADNPLPGNRSDFNETDAQSECLSMTYNNTKQIYSLPYFVSPGYDYKIWFKPLKGEESISIQFDFSLLGTLAEFPNHSFTYSVIPLQWHLLEIVAGREAPTTCLRWAELKIKDISVEKCLPHHTISRIQVSSAKNLVLWSTCPPEGDWWDELAGPLIENPLPETTTYVLAASLAVALICLVIVSVYVCYLRTSGKFLDYFTIKEHQNAVI